MALQLKDSLYGIEVQAYIKISGVDIREDWEFEDGSKKYSVAVILNYYTNSDKTNQYKQELEDLKDLKESELLLPTIYGKIMSLEKFREAKFV